MKSNHQLARISQQELQYPETSSLFGESGGFSYPGIENPYGGGGRPNLPAPFTPQTPAAGGGGGGGLFGSSINLNQIKGFVDRMGGIDGIVSTMTRVQKMVSSFQQMAPMLKLLMGSFAGGKAASKAYDDGDGLGRYSRRRKRRRKKGKGAGTKNSYRRHSKKRVRSKK